MGFLILPLNYMMDDDGVSLFFANTTSVGVSI